MSHRPRRSAIVFLLLLVLVGSAGCLGDGGQADLPESETVADSLGSVDAVEATIHLQLQQGNETTELTMDVIRRTQTGEFRATLREESADTRVRMVSNGSTMWVHNRSSGSVDRVQIDGFRTEWNRTVTSVSGLFGGLKRPGEEDVSISPLPVVPPRGGASAGAVGGASMPAMGNVSMTYRQTATVDGREAYVVGLDPTGNESVVTNATIWFDAERYFPVKAEYEMSVGGQARETTITYRNLTVNPSVSSGTFEFDPPANVTNADGTSSISVYQTRAALVNGTDQSVPEPDVPPEYSFAQSSTLVEGSNRTLAMQYSNGSGTIVVSKQTGPAVEAAEPEGESVEVGSHDGVYRERNGRRSLTWQCNESRYAVTGSVSQSRLTTIAESMVCE